MSNTQTFLDLDSDVIIKAKDLQRLIDETAEKTVKKL